MTDFIAREPILIVADILKTVMSLRENQVILTNQKYLIPTTGILIDLSYLGPAKIICRKSTMEDDGQGGQREVLSANVQNQIGIDILGMGQESMFRKEEIAMAMGSIYAQEQMGKYCVQIARHIGDMIDSSFLEATKMVTRYSSSIICTSVKRLVRTNAEYYSEFQAELHTDPKTAHQPIDVSPQSAHP